MRVYPSILGADFGNLSREIASIESYADAIHIDIMDGHFVPNLSFGLPVLRCIQSDLPLDVHLMVSNPSDRFDELIQLGVNRICFHVEIDENIQANITYLRDAGVKSVGLAIDNGTDASAVLPYIHDIDYIIVMTVQAGFSGQAFIEKNLEKVQEIKNTRSDIEVMIDGGVNLEHATLGKQFGVDSVAATSYIFGTDDRDERVKKLKQI